MTAYVKHMPAGPGDGMVVDLKGAEKVIPDVALSAILREDGSYEIVVLLDEGIEGDVRVNGRTVWRRYSDARPPQTPEAKELGK